MGKQNLVYSKKFNVTSYPYVLLIASLPFFSIRPSGIALSAPLFFLFIIAFLSLFNIFLKAKYYSSSLIFDVLILTLMLIATMFSASVEMVENIALIKSLTYFSLYILLKQLMINMGYESLVSATFKGIILGVSLYLILVIYAISISGDITSLFQSLTYQGFTMKIYQIISTDILSKNDLESADIMRNSIGEVFAFYFIFTFIKSTTTNKIKRSTKTIFLWLGLVLTLLTFSRRAFFSIAISFFISTLHSGKILSKVLNIFAFILVLYAFIFVFSGEVRYIDFERDTRLTQYSVVLDKISNEMFLGYGYGAKITHLGKEKYVHNFLLANWYMMGLAGLLSGLTILLFTVKQYVTPIFKSKNFGYSYLLIIPILGMSIGGTVEGIFTLTSWIIFAFYHATKYFQNNSQHF